MAEQKQIRIYTDQSVVTLQKDEMASRSKLKGVIDFVHYLRYRDSVAGEYTLRAKKLGELQDQFFSQYHIVEAAGGVVINEKNEVLMIYRRGFWDLPKGKLEKGEKKRDCAIREVEEECGVSGVEIHDKLRLYYNGKKTTYHTYRYKRRPTLKPSYWYVMKTKKQKLTPQTSEDITKAVWIPLDEVEQYYDLAYPAIRDVLMSVKQVAAH